MKDVVEILSMDSIYQEEKRRGQQRMQAILGDSYEQDLALKAPNDARACVERPAVFKED